MKASGDHAVEVQTGPLLDVLFKLIMHLRSLATEFSDYTDWEHQLHNARLRVARGDPFAVTALAAMFGGMGSLNDLYLDDEGAQLRRELATTVHRLIHDLGLR